MNRVTRTLVRIHRSLLPDDPHIGWMPYVWLVFLIPFVAETLSSDLPATERAARFAGLLGFLFLYFAGYWREDRRLLPIIAAIAILGAIFTPRAPGAIAFFVFAGSFTGMAGPPRRGTAALSMIVAFIIAHGVIFDLPAMQWIICAVFTALIGTVNIYYVENARKNSALRLSEAEVQRLAVVAERERIARDLHDLLGHTLSVITLKSQLAGRLVERDPQRAINEIRDVEAVSREALAQVREAVAGYRSTFAQEIANARRALEAAGIELRWNAGPFEVPKSIEATLARVLREGVTNVVRHSGAGHCHVSIELNGDQVALVIRDDGIGGNYVTNGMGLDGLRRALEEVGGKLEVRADGGTVLTATVPRQSSPPT